MHFSGEEDGRTHDASCKKLINAEQSLDNEDTRTRTFGEEKLSFGKIAPYSFTQSRICLSSSGNAYRLGVGSSSYSSSSSSLSSESVLSAGLTSL